MIHVINEFHPICLDKETSIRMLEHRLKDNTSVDKITHLFPTERSLGITFQDLITDFERNDLSGKRLVKYGAYDKILEVHRANGKISYSKEVGYDVFHLAVRDFSDQLESALWRTEWMFPGIFPEKSIAITTELFTRLFVETYTAVTPPKLFPPVTLSPETANHFCEKYVKNLPWKRGDYNGAWEITKTDSGYRFQDIGERGDTQKEFSHADPLVLSRMFLDYIFNQS